VLVEFTHDADDDGLDHATATKESLKSSSPFSKYFADTISNVNVDGDDTYEVNQKFSQAGFK
jgi:hypothetical protein